MSVTCSKVVFIASSMAAFPFSRKAAISNRPPLLIGNGRLDVGGWGFSTDYSAAVPGTVYSLDLRSRKKTLVSTQRGSWAGLCADDRSGFFAADFEGGGLYHVSRAGEARRIARLPRGSAGLLYVPEAQLLVVPETRQNRVVGYDLAPQTVLK